MPSQNEANNTPLSETQARLLLETLCERDGFCLSALWQERLTRFPPRSADKFTDTVFRAEGLDSAMVEKRIYAAVHKEVRAAFERSAAAATVDSKPD